MWLGRLNAYPESPSHIEEYYGSRCATGASQVMGKRLHDLRTSQEGHTMILRCREERVDHLQRERLQQPH